MQHLHETLVKIIKFLRKVWGPMGFFFCHAEATENSCGELRSTRKCDVFHCSLALPAFFFCQFKRSRCACFKFDLFHQVTTPVSSRIASFARASPGVERPAQASNRRCSCLLATKQVAEISTFLRLPRKMIILFSTVVLIFLTSGSLG